MLAQSQESRAPASAGAQEFLAFTLGEEEYGIDIQKVQEIRGYEAVTKMANAPDYLKGVVNLRGIIVPIVNLRIRFKLPDPAYDQFTVVIIVNLAGNIIGMVVDSVSDVTNLEAEQIKAAPAVMGVMSGDYLIGIGTIDDRMLILVNVDRLLGSQEMGMIKQLSA